MCVGVNFSEQISIWKLNVAIIGIREQKWGLGGEKIKTMKTKTALSGKFTRGLYSVLVVI